LVDGAACCRCLLGHKPLGIILARWLGHGCHIFFHQSCPRNSAASGHAKRLDRVREIIRIRHYSLSTEQSYVFWIRRFTLRVFHDKRHPMSMGGTEIEAR
jgi:hypothetical protein